MSLLEKINEDLKQAMKDKDNVKLSTLRSLKSQIKNKQISLGTELTDSDISEVLAKQIKQRQDSIAQYKQGDRDDLVQSEQAEIEILTPYLPKQLSAEELETIITEAITSTDAQTMADMGKVMGIVTAKTKGQADNSQVAKIVRSKLQ